MEDAQPNEVRLARKGSTSVPRVRTASRAFSLFPSRGRGSARIHGSHSQQRQNNAAADPVQTTQRAHHPTLVHSTTPYYRNYPSSYDSKSSKRIKLGSFETSGARSDNGTDQVLVQLPLPPECYKGVSGYHQSRQAWTREQELRIATERQLSVVGFRYMDWERIVQFTCRTRLSRKRSTPSKVPQHAIVQARTSNSNVLDKTAMATPMPVSLPSTAEHDSQYFLGQINNVGGPRQVVCPTPGTPVNTHLRRLDNQPTTSQPSNATLQKGPIGVSLAKVSTPVQHKGTSPPPRMRVSIDLTSDDLSLAGNRPGRWTTFRSGALDVSLPSGASDPRHPTPVQAQLRNESPLPTSLEESPAVITNVCSLSPLSNIQRNKMTSVFLADSNLPSFSGLAHGCNIESHSRERPIVLEDDLEELPQIRALAFTCSNLPLSLGPRDKPRRLLHETASAYVVTAHGAVNQVRITNTLNLGRNIWSPPSPLDEFVDDVCMIYHRGERLMVLGHAREQNQLSLLRIRHGHAPRATSLCRDWNISKKSGVSALATLSAPLQFVSGGYDHRVHLWDIAEDLSGASASELSLRHTASVNSLLPVVDTSNKIVSVGADCNVRLFDISSERVVHSIKLSNIPYHAHKTDFQFGTLFEVSHFDTQFELHDRRAVPERPVQRFGFTAEEKNGRFMKGDSWSHYFVCGDQNGNVRLWDLRNPSVEVACLSCYRDQVMHVVKRGQHALACSRWNEVACIDFQAE